jgi:hypothetical protein
MVLQKGFLAHAGDVFTREPGSFGDEVEKIDEP